MNDWSPFWWVSCGVAVAVIFPVLSGFVRQEFKTTAAIGPTLGEEVWGVALIQPDYSSDLPGWVAFDAPE
jgi:hypothetical protein